MHVSISFLHWLWCGYLAVAMLLGTVGLLYLGYVGIFPMRAVLPNEYSLAPGFFDWKKENIRVLDKNGKQVVPPDVLWVMWCDDVVYGMRKNVDDPRHWDSLSKRGPLWFVHDGKTKKLITAEAMPVITTQKHHDDYRKLLAGIDTAMYLDFSAFGDEIRKRHLPPWDEKMAVDYIGAKSAYYHINTGDTCPR